jgi:hypothetical chaperone protein
MRTPKILRDIEEVARATADPSKLRNLISLISSELGYQLYQAVGAVKTELSRAESATLTFTDENFSIEQPITRQDFEAWIAPDLKRLGETIDAALISANLRAEDVDRVFLTGGTSFVPAVRKLFTARFGPERVSGGGEFVSVAEGLALIGRDRLAQKQTL